MNKILEFVRKKLGGGRAKVLLIRQGWAVLAVLVLCVVGIFVLFGNENIVGAAAQKRELPIYCVQREDKVASLTFDAAWGNEDTQQLIDILAKYDVKATFFVVGDWATKYPESVKALADAGHEIMNHSDKHKHMPQLSAEQIVADVAAANEKIAASSGVTPTLFRPPYGEYDDKVVSTLRSMGMYTIQWDVDVPVTVGKLWGARQTPVGLTQKPTHGRIRSGRKIPTFTRGGNVMIQTKYGKLEGIDRGWYTEYLGVPYAKPPVGELRWKAPQPPEPFDGVYGATRFADMSMQSEHSSPPWDKDFYDDPNYKPSPSEDCLYLNIWAPKDGKNCPVAFWIHGGAFMGGNASEKVFDGAEYCRRGVILVSIQYRLGIFGFLAHPWLTAEAGTSGNYGILDQIAALNWVHDNIGAFGGDPENITVFGQSAGAMSTQTLISSPLTKNLIKRAILQSGGSYGEGLHRDMMLEEQESYGTLFSEIMEVSDLAELRAKTTEEVFAGFGPFMQKAMPMAKGLFLVPVIDGHVLTNGYYAAMDDGDIKDIPYMIGSTKNDMLVQPGSTSMDDSPIHRGSVAFSHKLEELGRDPAYVYYFSRDLPGDEQGAWHSSELWYTFGTLPRCWRPWEARDYALSAKMLDYWTNFMRSGDPNADGLPTWEPCAKANSFVIELDR